MGLLGDIFHLFVPRICPVCGKSLAEGERLVCTLCRASAPLTDHPHKAHNGLLDRLREMQPIEHAAALMEFPRQSGWRNLVYQFKYEGCWREALEAGQWLGGELAAGGLFYDVDVVVPVPLHVAKKLRRGYNQAEYIAEGVAEALSRPLDSHTLVRHTNNPSQTLKHRDERWDNVADIFRLTAPERLAGKHILLIDDVLTSGATILSCASAITAACPDAKISIAVFATAKTI